VGVLEQVGAGLVGEPIAVLRRTSRWGHASMVRRSGVQPAPGHLRIHG
jgi:hypothetical protein